MSLTNSVFRVFRGRLNRLRGPAFDQPALDVGGGRQPDGQGFAAFGQVTRGMDAVRTIQMGTATGETLTPSVTILRVRRR